MKSSEFRKLIREEVRRVLKEAKGMSLGLPYPPRGGKIAAAFITVANKLGMKQSPYANKAGAGVAGDYGFIFEPMDGADGELVVIEDGEGVGNKKGNNPSAIIINNPTMKADPKIKELAKKCIKQYDESKSLNEVTGKAFALVIDEDGNFMQEDLASYFEETAGYEEPTKLTAAKVAKFPTEYDAFANAPELAKAENAKWVKAVAALNATCDFYDVLGDGGENAFIAAVPKGSNVEDYMGEG